MDTNRITVPRPAFCECSDPGCPYCKGSCKRVAKQTLFRTDMDDETGTKMCDACADDCMDSGLFYTNESQALTLVKALLDRGLTISEALKPMANAKASKKEWSDGIKVEREHATTTTTAKIIASHHLKEKPDYYKRLKKAGLADELK